MKKTGFTLAEVLITLAIIGVVATMTLPALMTNTQEQQAKTGLKKMINTLTLAAETNSALYGYDYSSITNESVNNEDPQKQTLYALFALNTNMDRDTNLTAKAPESKLRMLGGATDAGGDNYVVFFKDGSALSYDHNTLSTGNNAILQDDGIPYGIPILIDTNGLKGPNALSNCNGESLTATNDTHSNCNDKGKRVIKDQFSVRLRGIYATPNGYAARWAFDN